MTYINIERQGEGKDVLDRHRSSQRLSCSVTVAIVDVGDDSSCTKLCSENKHAKTQNDGHRPGFLVLNRHSEYDRTGNCQEKVRDQDDQTKLWFINTIVLS